MENKPSPLKKLILATSQVLKNDLPTRTKFFRILCVLLWTVPWRFHPGYYEKEVGQWFLSLGRYLFSGNLFPSMCYVVKRWYYNAQNWYDNTLWTLIKCSLTHFWVNFTRKTGPKYFLKWKNSLFFKRFVFNNLSGRKETIF